jgi:hypothetical protein
MSTKTPTSRRGFFGKASAALVAPLAATQAFAAEPARSDLSARVMELEDVNAIRALQRTYARLVNAGARGELAALFAEPHAAHVEPDVRAITGDGFDERDVVELGSDGTATACLHCTVEVVTTIGPTCTLVEMARMQGDGVLRRTEQRRLESAFVKVGGVWKIARTAFRAA